MNIAKMNIANYGNLQYRYEAMAKNGILEYMMYTDYKSGISMNLVRLQDVENLWYKGSITQSTKTRNIQTPKADKNIIHYLYNQDIPKLYNYKFSQTKSEDIFNVLFTINNRDIKIAVDKSKHVYFYPNSKQITICNENDKQEERYIFTNDGYISDLCDSDNIECVFNNSSEQVTFNIEKRNKIGIPMLDNVIISAEYNQSEIFKVSTDINGMVNKIYKDGKCFSRAESIGHNVTRDNYEEKIVIRPLLYDCFNYDYISDPFKYYAEDRLLVNNDYLSFYRNVYEIEKFDDLIKIIDNNFSVPIIEFNE